MTLLYFCIAATEVFLAPPRAQSWALANTRMVDPNLIHLQLAYEDKSLSDERVAARGGHRRGINRQNLYEDRTLEQNLCLYMKLH